MVACLQSSPPQKHSATQVIRPPVTESTARLILHLRYSPACSQEGHFACRTATAKWVSAHTRPCPVMLTVNVAFSLSGTHFLMTSPDNKHACCGCGFHFLESVKNVYMSVDASDRHVSLLPSLRRTDSSALFGGSRTGWADTETKDKINHEHVVDTAITSYKATDESGTKSAI